ncbi:MAG: hypothetical protein ACI8UR_000578 [Natronomonas sp.]|jgi:hypothetical protein|uniref:hypothetical protein n=1 Tax=Natronomonas sp. TaxID=2184060 RepID=UPI003988E0EB
MELGELADQNWNSYEKKRFLKDGSKLKTDSFDPESFKHDGFDDRERYLDTYVPALADERRLEKELTNFTPPRLSSINDSPYQALVIRYGVLRTLIRQPDFSMDKKELQNAVQSWQQELIRNSDQDDLADDELLHLAKAAVNYGSDVDDSELHMVYRYFELHNRAQEWKHHYYTWIDVFERLSSIDRFPKVSRSEKPEHALDTIEKGIWSLQEQALVYEIVDSEHGDTVGIPEEYTGFIADWLNYEMTEENYLTMLETLEPFDKQAILVEASDTFNITAKNHGRNQLRRENILNAGIFPSDLFEAVLSKEQLKEIVDQYGLDAHKRRSGEMIEAIIEYFERSQRSVDNSQDTVELFLDAYEDIADGTVRRIPPQLQGLVENGNHSKKLEILFEEATAEIFRNVFNLGGTELLGQQASGIVADGEIEQDGKWLLWDNKRRAGKFKLSSSTQSKIKNYIDTKSQQHDVEWFLIIAPEFTSIARTNANQMEKQVGGIDIRLMRASDFTALARFWQDSFEDDAEFPLSMFYGSDIVDVETTKDALEKEFS